MRLFIITFITLVSNYDCFAEQPGISTAASLEHSVAITTTGGSRIYGSLISRQPWVLRNAQSGQVLLDPVKIKSISLGDRPDPNVENVALLALGDLQSDQFLVRQKGLATLRLMGRKAIRPLRMALTSPDPELLARAREILGELNNRDDEDDSTDRVILVDGSTIKGELVSTEMVLRSRWGIFSFPVQDIESIKFMKPDEITDVIVFDSVVPAELARGQCCVWQNSGERWVGTLTDAGLEHGLALVPEFIPTDNPPVHQISMNLPEGVKSILIALDDIKRFVPPRCDESQSVILKSKKGTPHGVLLQSGESFRARLLKLDEIDVLLQLSDGVELKLPRGALRKLDLQPTPPGPGEAPAFVTVGENEKPGIKIRSHRAATPQGDPNPEPEKDPVQKGEAGAESKSDDGFENAEVVSADPTKGELTIKDDAGEWTIGFPLAQTLVFSKDPNALIAKARFRDWVLTLREGSQFEISVLSITRHQLVAEMVGGVVTLPWQVIESIQRRQLAGGLVGGTLSPAK